MSRQEHAPDIYTAALTSTLRPKYGPTYAPLLARAYVDFTNDRAPTSANGEERRAYLTEARQRFEARVRVLKTGWAQQNTGRAA